MKLRKALIGVEKSEPLYFSKTRVQQIIHESEFYILYLQLTDCALNVTLLNNTNSIKTIVAFMYILFPIYYN